MDLQKLTRARALLADVTPLNRDCGFKCGAACCQPDDDGHGGVFLFPGEGDLIGEDWASISAIPGGPGDGQALFCNGTCPRDRRPLGCMIFPLTPVVDDDGHITMRFDVRARPICPLVNHGLMGIRQDFRAAATAAMEIIASDPEGLNFLRQWAALEEQYHFTL